MSREQAIVESAASKDAQERVWESFRRWGYLQANLDPLGDLEPAPMPELDVCGTGSGRGSPRLLRQHRR